MSKPAKSETNPPEQGVSRRDFLKKGALAVASLTAAGYILKQDFFKNVLLGSPADSITPFKTKITLGKWTRKAYYHTSRGGLIECGLCPNECRLDVGGRGICRSRVNVNGVLHTLSYGNPCSVNIDPIEKKPLYHFLPETKAFSIATGGCNLRCKFCQNWEISQTNPEDLKTYEMPPEKLVENVLTAKSRDSLVKSIAYTYSEPTAFYDYMLDSSKLAKSKGIRNTVITAGYINEKPLKELCSHVHAIKVDLKGFSEKFYRDVCAAELEDVLSSLKVIHSQKGVWLEIVNLVVPTLNDDLDEIKAMSEWVNSNLGSEVPLHFSRFHPDYKLKNLPPTPPETLVKAQEIAFNAGLKYVYIGNLATEKGGNTYCPRDETLCVERNGYIVKNHLKDGKCPTCGTNISGIWI
ncbi:MAG: AmmeMemoRadiSam system radical SAM enzyme [Methanobacteriota archaeon]